MNQKIYFNGNIITMIREGDYAEALVTEDEKIIFIGSVSEAKRKYTSAELKDLHGKTLMPSFIDPHSHITLTMQMITRVDLGGCTTNDEIVQTIKQFICNKGITEEGIVVGYNYDHNMLPGYKYPDKKVLNMVSTKIPIIIIHVSLHMAVCNDKALELAGYNLHEENPEGGIYGRIIGTNELDGYLEERAMDKAFKFIRERENFDNKETFKLAQNLYLQNGITTVQDGLSGKEDIELLKMLAQNNCLDVDVVSYIDFSNDIENIFEENSEYDQKYKNHFKIGGYKLLLDGAPQSKSAWLTKPYLNSGDYVGYPRLQDTFVEKCCMKAINENRQLLTHCNGDAAGDQLLRCYTKALEYVDNPQKNELRPVMIHCQTARDDQFEKMANILMIASLFPGHVFFWGDTHIRNLGIDRAKRIAPAKSAMKSGLIYTFHQDTPVTKPQMFHSIWILVNRITREGVKLGAEQSISVFEALKGVTINAAYSYFEENRKGSLEVGKLADIIICDKNPLEVDPMEIKDIVVLETIKEGKTLYCKN